MNPDLWRKPPDDSPKIEAAMLRAENARLHVVIDGLLDALKACGGKPLSESVVERFVKLARASVEQSK